MGYQIGRVVLVVAEARIVDVEQHHDQRGLEGPVAHVAAVVVTVIPVPVHVAAACIPAVQELLYEPGPARG
ncbi:hypothetical protein G6F22_021662 [Rhizopus arrhizus]|nr:hypothetical protein G6F22_021662 [Rhizopus arrhizus]KAG1364825.1 hypothetical protein G6F59_018912 [Rhizopus arrhizus]KAG1487122.1 hypothetical protein G6F52_014236 [Rhizopus delemar]